MKRVLLCLMGLCIATPVWAVEKIYTPYVSKGEWEIVARQETPGP